MSNPPALSHEYFYNIGLLVTNMTRTESYLIDFASICANVHVVQALIMIGTQQFTNKIDTVRALYALGYQGEDTDPDEMKSDLVLNLISKIRAVGDFRNTVVHGIWAEDEHGTPVAVRYSARGKLSRARHAITAEEIHEKAIEAEMLGKQLRGVVAHLRGIGKAGEHQPTG